MVTGSHWPDGPFKKPRKRSNTSGPIKTKSARRKSAGAQYTYARGGVTGVDHSGGIRLSQFFISTLPEFQFLMDLSFLSWTLLVPYR